MKKYLMLAGFTVSALGMQAQDWDTFGNTGIFPGTHFLGTLENDPLDLRTNNIHRFRLLPDATYALNGFLGQVNNGSLLLCPDITTFTAPGP